jgi:hypothetical protein
MVWRKVQATASILFNVYCQFLAMTVIHPVLAEKQMMMQM